MELEEEHPDPKLLRAALKNVVDARVQMNNLSEEAKLYYEKLNKILLETEVLRSTVWLNYWMHWGFAS